MFKLFDRLMGRETSVMLNVDFEDPTSGSAFVPLSFICNSKSDFADVYEGIKLEIENVQSSSKNTTFKIKLNGKLNGNDLKQEFKDLDSYRYFLENNSLIKPSIRFVN